MSPFYKFTENERLLSLVQDGHAGSFSKPPGMLFLELIVECIENGDYRALNGFAKSPDYAGSRKLFLQKQTNYKWVLDAVDEILIVWKRIEAKYGPGALLNLEPHLGCYPPLKTPPASMRKSSGYEPNWLTYSSFKMRS